MILLIDNYDSFVHNIARYVGELGRERRVVRNDAIDVDDITAEMPEAIILSPGPGTPDDAGVSLDVVRRLGERVPILGVCLGHQCIGQVYGGTVRRAQRPGSRQDLAHQPRRPRRLRRAAPTRCASGAIIRLSSTSRRRPVSRRPPIPTRAR